MSVAASDSNGRRGIAWWLSIGWLAIVVVAALGANWLAPHPHVLHTTETLQGPSWRHPFGTSKIGHDLFQRSIHGARLLLVLSLTATIIGLVVGGTLGVVAGYFRGALQTVILVVLDAWIALPSLMVLLAVVTYLNHGVWSVAVALGFLVVPLFARVARTAVLTYADREFVLAARMVGARHRRIIGRDLLPNIAVPIGAYACLVMGLALVLEGSLSFLGVGLGVRQTTWGELVVEGQRDIDRYPYLALIPAGLFVATILALNIVGDLLAARYDGTARIATVGPRRRARQREDRGAVVAGALRARPDSGALLVLDEVRTLIDTPAGRVRAVDGVSLSLRAGETLAIVGESGSGKTMLARSILGVLPAAALTSGHVFFDGKDLRALSSSAMRAVRGRDIAMIFQDPMTSLDPVMRVGDQIAELVQIHRALGPRGRRRRAARARAVELLAQMGVADPERVARRYPHELSGGIRQRVAIAMALSCEPKLLIADEPTSALDVTVQAQILDLLREQQRARGLAMILVTHDLGVVAGYADTVAVMYAGRVVEDAPTRSLFAAPMMPYTVALLAAVPRLGGVGRVLPVAIGGQPPDLVATIDGCAFAPRCSHATDECLESVPPLDGVTMQHRVACFHPRLASQLAASGPPNSSGVRALRITP